MARFRPTGGLLLAVALAGTLGARSLNAQVDNPIVFLEKSYLSVLSPVGKGLILEGEVANHYFILNGLDDPVWLQGKNKQWAFTWPVSMVIVLRIFKDFSSPIRTPSFILRPLKLQAFRLNVGDREGSGPEATHPYSLLGLSAAVVHHSNGQSGCTFQGFEAQDTILPNGKKDVICLVDDPLLAEQRVTNLRDGTFSTNFLSAEVAYRWGTLDFNMHVKRHWTAALDAEFHLGGIKGTMEDEVERQYGRAVLGGRIEGEFQVASGWTQGTLRVEASGRLWFGGLKQGATGAGAIELSHVFDRANHWGLFGRAHFGRDYYNIWYQDEGWWLQFGMMWNPGRLDTMMPVGEP